MHRTVPRCVQWRSDASDRAYADANVVSSELGNQQPIELASLRRRPGGQPERSDATERRRCSCRDSRCRADWSRSAARSTSRASRRRRRTKSSSPSAHSETVARGAPGVGPRNLGAAVARLGQVKNQSAERVGRGVRPRDHQRRTSSGTARGDGRGSVRSRRRDPRPSYRRL